MTEHACVRVGPVNGATLIAGWPHGCVSAGSHCRGGHVVTGMVLATGTRASSQSLESADVIVGEGEAGSALPGEWLDRFPGCAVAATWIQRGECCVATRDGVISTVAISGQDAVGALACAVFVHGWLVAARPMRALYPAFLEVSYPASAVTGATPGSPLFFRFSYCPGAGADRG
jgi:hypothetical protein